MPTITDIRQQFPQYGDMSDEQLASALHRKFYSDMPFQDFAAKVGIQQQASPKTAADETGAGEAALIAAGRTLDRLYQGGKQMALNVPAAFGNQAAKDALAKQALDEAEKTKYFDQLNKASPWATTLGGVAPLLAAPVLGGGALGMAASAAIPGLVEYGTPQERLTRGALGAAGGLAGAGLGKALGLGIQPVRAVPDAARRDALAAAERIGYVAPVGQQTGSRAVQTIEQQLGKNPISAGGAQRLNDANQRAVNQAYAKAIGENATSITDDVLNAAKSRIGQEFNDIAGRNTVDLTHGPLLNRLVTLDTEQRALGPFSDPAVTMLIDKGLDFAAKGKVDGKTYQVIRSELGRKAESAFNGGNSSLGIALREVKTALDEAANASVSAADKKAWEVARTQWQSLKLANTRNGVIEGGNVSAAKLATKVDKARGVADQGILDIAKIGETFKPLPDSGTAGNSVAQLLISGGAGLLGPQALASTIAGPFLTQKFVQSKAGQKYLTEGIAKVTPEMERLLMLSGAGLLSAPATLVR